MSRKGSKTTTQPIDWDDAMMLLDRLRDTGNDNTRLMLACGFFFGLRISDILLLKWKDLMSSELKVIEQKNSKQRVIKFNKEFLKIRDQVISNYPIQPNKDSLIFIYDRKGADPNKPISKTAANKRIKKVFERYRIKVSNPSSHTLRKTFGRRVYEHFNRSEDALIKLSQMFNHSNVAITRRYIGITQEMIDDIYMSI